mmetsp:Transcript_46410/g.115495  ORF Transcript_46410/g.115495 Transcript_46410/m.115495 type:complete len:148 (-) Transcript_46410:1418-1861(-)
MAYTAYTAPLHLPPPNEEAHRCNECTQWTTLPLTLISSLSHTNQHHTAGHTDTHTGIKNGKTARIPNSSIALRVVRVTRSTAPAPAKLTHLLAFDKSPASELREHCVSGPRDTPTHRHDSISSQHLSPHTHTHSHIHTRTSLSVSLT